MHIERSGDVSGQLLQLTVTAAKTVQNKRAYFWAAFIARKRDTERPHRAFGDEVSLRVGGGVSVLGIEQLLGL